MDFLKKDGLIPSRIVLGTAGYGSGQPEDLAFRIMDAYVEAGGNVFDTANVYAAWLPGGEGKSELCVGNWLKRTGMRDQVFISTKGAHPPLDDMTHGRCSREDIESDLAVSLDRLGVDHVEMYWLHRDDIERPVGDIVETMASLMDRGLIGAYGGSNWIPERLQGALNYAKEHGLPPMAGSQPAFNLADEDKQEAIDIVFLFVDDKARLWHEKTQLVCMPHTSQARGYFGKANVDWYKAGGQGPAPLAGTLFDTPGSKARLGRAIEMAEKKECTAAQINLAYLLNQPFPVYPIVGTSHVERVATWFPVLDIELTRAECDYLRDGK